MTNRTAKYAIQVLVDGKVVLTQQVDRRLLDDDIYPLLEGAAQVENRRRERRKTRRLLRRKKKEAKS